MIKITADSTCDLSPELLAKYDISLAPLHVLVNEEDFLDGVNITPKDIFHFVSVENKTCSTAAINTYEYEQFLSHLQRILIPSFILVWGARFHHATKTRD